MGLCLIYDIALIFSFEKFYIKEDEINIICEVINLREETTYKNKYIVKTINKEFKNIKLILYTDKNYIFSPGDILNISGDFRNPDESRNYKEFNYKNYLKQNKILGIVYVNKANKISIKYDKYYFRGKILNKILENTNKIYCNNSASFISGILFGYTKNIQEELKENFRIVNISHILAISGMHIFYIVKILLFIFKKIFKNKKIQNYSLIILLTIFWFMTGESVSCARACIMEIIFIIGFLNFRKYSFYRSIFISFIIIIIINPYNFFNIGMWLSYFGILGINLFYKFFSEILFHYIKKHTFFQKVMKIIVLSISAQIMVFPIIVYNFNTFSYSFLLSSIIVSIFLDKIIILGYISVLLSFININFGLFFSNINEIIINIFFDIIEFLSNLPFSKIYIKTPYMINICIYYILIFIICYFSIKNKHYILRLFCSITFIKIQIRRLYLKNKKLVFLFLIIILLFFFFKIVINEKYLNMWFIDVRQGDCTLIKTPKGKIILIDGGEGNSEKYDYGKNVVLPYLLDRKITKIDYIIISHFDSDHVGGIISIIKELPVDKIIIGKQFENSKNYCDFIEQIENKNIKIQVVEAKNKIYIEKDVFFEILWPCSNNIIKENILNNNSIVCKLIYKQFSCIFTGDIEEIAELEILKKYENSNILNSNILKIAHHGSKTSSSIEFLEKVKPQYALIGVGKENNFGHPSNITIQNLKNIFCNIYRTDINGEISIKTDGKKITIKTMFNK